MSERGATADPATVLVTSVGSGVGQAIAYATRLHSPDARIVGATTPPANAGTALCDVWRPVSIAADRASFEADVLALARDERPDLVLAGRDDDVVALAGIGQELASLGARVPGPPPATAAMLRDKLLMAQMLADHGLAACETVGDLAGIADLLERHRGPVILKPRRGDGSRGVSLCHDVEEAERTLANSTVPLVAQPLLRARGASRPRRGDPIIQADELSAQCVILEHCIAGPFVTLNSLHQGIPDVASVVEVPHAAREALAVAACLRDQGVTGPVNIQAKATERDRTQIFEVNVRCTGLTGARAQMGFNELGLMLDDWTAAEVGPPTTPVGTVAYRAWGYAVSTLETGR